MISRLIVAVNSLWSDVVIINELEYFRIAYIIKRIFPKKIVVHYNTEMYGKEEGMPCRDSMMNFYKKHASFPDMIIECLPERAEYRKNKYEISKPIFVINNTVPMLNYSGFKGDGWKHYIDFKNDLPILIYAGGCNLSRGLQAIIDIMRDFEGKLNFLLFCYGTNENIDLVKTKCLGISNCIVHKAVDRETLFQIMQHCHIGLQYYNPELSINNKLAAPSKFFEYMAMGLNVFSTNNIGINKIIEENGIGICFENDSKMKIALNELLDKNMKDRAQIIEIFERKYCYEIESKETVEHLISLLKRR